MHSRLRAVVHWVGIVATLMWAHSVRPYTTFSGLAPKERQSLAQGVPPWDSILCVLVVKAYPWKWRSTIRWAANTATVASGIPVGPVVTRGITLLSQTNRLSTSWDSK